MPITYHFRDYKVTIFDAFQQRYSKCPET